MTRTIRIVEDDGAVAESLVSLLESWGFLVEAFPDGEALLGAPEPGRPDCILLDVRLPGMDGLAVLRALRRRGDPTPVIVLTGHGDVAMAVRAVRDGAQDFVEKPFDDEDLVRRIEAAGRSETAADATLEPEAESFAARFAALTPRETEVMQEVVAGHANKVIAHRLGLSPRTVEVHRARVMEKTGAASLSQLVRLALKAGIDPDEGLG